MLGHAILDTKLGHGCFKKVFGTLVITAIASSSLAESFNASCSGFYQSSAFLGCVHGPMHGALDRPLAELVTSQGREILQSTVDLVQGTIGAEALAHLCGVSGCSK